MHDTAIVKQYKVFFYLNASPAECLHYECVLIDKIEKEENQKEAKNFFSRK